MRLQVRVQADLVVQVASLNNAVADGASANAYLATLYPTGDTATSLSVDVSNSIEARSTLTDVLLPSVCEWLAMRSVRPAPGPPGMFTTPGVIITLPHTDR